MQVSRAVAAFLASLLATYFLSTLFFTERVIAQQSEFGIGYTRAQWLETFWLNFSGLWALGIIIAITLGLAFAIAWGLKKFVRPLAPLAYPIAGGTGMLAMIALVEAQLGGGAGIIGGARTPLGVALQCLAGVVGGSVFAVLRPR